MNLDGQLQIEYLEHLDNCINLFDESKNPKTKKGLEFIVSLDIKLLKIIMTKFDLRKYVIRFAHFSGQLSINEIENLLFLKGNFIDLDIFNIIFNSYHSFKEDQQKWLKNIYKNKEIFYTNYEIVIWITLNPEIYKKFQNLMEFLKLFQNT